MTAVLQLPKSTTAPLVGTMYVIGPDLGLVLFDFVDPI